MIQKWLILSNTFVKSSVIIFLIFIISCVINKFNCDQWEYKLVNDIMSDYDPSIRPSIHHNSSLNVTFGLALTQLIDVVSNLSIIYFFEYLLQKIT